MEFSDEELINILEEIDGMAGGVTSWEADFIENIFEQQPSRFTPKQRDVIMSMYNKYLAGA